MLGGQYSEPAPFWFPSMNIILSNHADTDILYLNLLGRDMIILNSSKTISDLLDKRSKIYSDKVCVSSFFAPLRPGNRILNR